MCQLLMSVLKEKVPVIPFNEVFVVEYHTSLQGWPNPFYVIDTDEPVDLLKVCYDEFWTCLRRLCPDWHRLALEQGTYIRPEYPDTAAMVNCCPVFATRERLLTWLCRTLQLPDSVRNLLLLYCPVVVQRIL